LRAHDYARAERSFGALVHADSPRVRDEARLARAQVWLAQGRTAEARPELEALATQGATTLTRQRASETLKTMKTNP
jgi:hypothetical protein